MTVRKRRSDRSGRSALPSPGRLSVARREDHRQFWAAIAAGRSSEDAAVGAGVSPAVLGPEAEPPAPLIPAEEQQLMVGALQLSWEFSNRVRHALPEPLGPRHLRSSSVV